MHLFYDMFMLIRHMSIHYINLEPLKCQMSKIIPKEQSCCLDCWLHEQARFASSLYIKGVNTNYVFDLPHYYCTVQISHRMLRTVRTMIANDLHPVIFLLDITEMGFVRGPLLSSAN